MRTHRVSTLSALAGGALAFLIAMFLAVVHYTEAGEAAVMRNLVTGRVSIDHPGWNISPPWVQASHVDLRPMRVCITSAGRGYACKLVQFQSDAFDEFVRVEGFRYWWWANRISFNLGYDEEYRGFRDIMRGHAFGAEPYPFVTVLDAYVEP